MLQFILAVVLIGVVLWLVTTYVPMDARIKNLLVILSIIGIIIWFISLIGLLGGLNAPFPRI